MTRLMRIIGGGICALHLLWLPAVSRQPDGIPRNRLLSDAELLAQLRAPADLVSSASALIARGDAVTARARLAAYFSARTTPRFFFTRDEVTDRVREYVRLFPKDVEESRRRGNAFISTYGADVDWMMPGKDLRGRAHTPNTVRYLARQWEAVNLALRFYQELENPKILAFLTSQVRDFANDFSAGKVETGDNDVFERFYGGHRTRNWIMMHQLLLASKLYTPDDQVLMLKLLLLHGAKLADQSRQFNWGNHQLVGLVALYEISVLFPEFKESERWHEQSRKLILQHLEKEIAPDGFQAERSSHYHKLDIANYFLVLQLARLNGEDLPKVFHERFRNMFRAMAQLAMPNKSLPILQDVSDSVFVRTDRIDEEMSLGALLYGDRSFRYFARDEFPATLYWLFDRDAERRYRSLKPEKPRVTSTALAQTGYYVMREGWNQGDLYLLIDGGLAADKPDHTHGGVLGVIGYALGEVFLPNYPVRYSDRMFEVMKNSLAKNVALVDELLQGRGWIPNRARTGFGRWDTLPTPRVDRWITGSECDFFAGSHDAFANAGVSYKREIVFLKPDGWLVLDSFTSDSEHRYKQVWQGEFRILSGERKALRPLRDGAIELLPVGAPGMLLYEHTAAHARGILIECEPTRSAVMGTFVHVARGAGAPKAVVSTEADGGSLNYSIQVGKRQWIVTLDPVDPDPIGQTVSTTITRLVSRQEEAVLAVAASAIRAGDLRIDLSRRASAQVVRDKRRGWVFTLLSKEPVTITVRGKGGTLGTYEVSQNHDLPLSVRRK